VTLSVLEIESALLAAVRGECIATLGALAKYNVLRSLETLLPEEVS
jgi:hypothetical protein